MSEVHRCAGTRKDGTPCSATIFPPQTFCWWHDPAYADKRSANASKAAKSKGSTELTALKARLRELLDAVVEGKLEKGRGSVAAQLAGVLIRCVEEERKILETVELEERLSALERSYGIGSNGRRMGHGQVR